MIPTRTIALTPSNVEAVVTDIAATGGTALGLSADVSNPEQIKATVNNAFDASVVPLRA